MQITPEPYSAGLLKIWLADAINYDTVSIYFEGRNPYDIPAESIYEAFWDSIEDWAQENMTQFYGQRGEEQ